MQQPASGIIAKVNDVAIVVLQKEKLVPIKPICEALGVDYSTQLQKVKEDDILVSVMGLSPTTGSDGKTYQMQCLPLEFVFGWLFSINHKNVKTEAQEAVKRYKLECYHALYKHFTEYADFMEYRQMMIDEALNKVETIRIQFNQTKNLLAEGNQELQKARTLNFSDWKTKQGTLPFPEA